MRCTCQGIQCTGEYTIYPEMDTLHPSAGQDPFGSRIDMDVCAHNAGRKNGCDCVTEEAHRFGVLFVHQYIYIYLVMCNPEFQQFKSFNFYDGSKGG